MKKLKVAVTGANGFVGSRIADFLRKKGCEVYEIGRHPSSEIKNSKYFIYHSLGKGIDQDKLKNIDVLVHCAYDFSLTSWEDIKKINVNGSVKLLESAKKAKLKKIIFISTVSAFEGCTSMYGKAKLTVEKEAKKIAAFIVRPGLVFGKNAGGMVGSLNKIISASKFAPLVGSGKQMLYLCHNKDLGETTRGIS